MYSKSGRVFVLVCEGKWYAPRARARACESTELTAAGGGGEGVQIHALAVIGVELRDGI